MWLGFDMGAEVEAESYTPEQRQRYREKVQTDLDVFTELVANNAFRADKPMTGLEIELNLVDDDFQPNFVNSDALAAIADPEFQTELALYNIELNVPPRPLPGNAALHLEQSLRDSLNAANEAAGRIGAHLVCIGILPTLREDHFVGEWMSASNRYAALNNSIVGARGNDIALEIQGPTGETLEAHFDSIAPESACTSVQLHLQVSSDEFAPHWNAAQAIAGPQVALAANSPFLFGKRLYAETRIPLFEQTIDTAPVVTMGGDERKRVFFGERWITSVVDLFDENARYFTPLLADVSQEDPQAILADGGVPLLPEMTLHNGTVYRWNRPIYAVAEGQPHLRIENRVLSAGPTISDTMANAAFYYGLLRALTMQQRPLWTEMSFRTAHENFRACARDGIYAKVSWPGFDEVSVPELVVEHLLPLAAEGLDSWGVSRHVRERYLGIIEQRAKLAANGATWQVNAVAALQARGVPRDRALTLMLRDYVEHMNSNVPVHAWPRMSQE